MRIGEVMSGAVFSEDRTRRYKLWRVWDPSKGRVLFIGLNPSRAGEVRDDPTLRRCIDFGKRLGYGGMFMGNLFSIISPDPYVLPFEVRVDEVNRNALLEMGEEAETVVGAWGVQGSKWYRNDLAREDFKDMMCLGVTKSGEPKHPLYLPGHLKLMALPLVKQAEKVM